ncbi:hypothetical protein GRJ2_002469900 [Grus japonensis]|uniref:Uncharacterized protein n=1 Tax=Grus japonensis TaxID=30415 RepID=A0ABC9XQP7_GRUJA
MTLVMLSGTGAPGARALPLLWADALEERSDRLPGGTGRESPRHETRTRGTLRGPGTPRGPGTVLPLTQGRGQIN